MPVKPTETIKVDEYLDKLDYPQKAILVEFRKIILTAHDLVGEEIKWNSPTFFYTGELSISDPKEYRRVLVVTNLYKKDVLRVVVWQGASVDTGSGMLTGNYADGRRLATFCNMGELISRETELQDMIRTQILEGATTPILSRCSADCCPAPQNAPPPDKST